MAVFEIMAQIAKCDQNIKIARKMMNRDAHMGIWARSAQNSSLSSAKTRCLKWKWKYCGVIVEINIFVICERGLKKAILRKAFDRQNEDELAKPTIVAGNKFMHRCVGK